MTTTAHLAPASPCTQSPSAQDKPIAIRLGQQELEEALSFAYEEDRPAGNFARLVFLLGMQVYRSQGCLMLHVGTAQPARSRWQAASGLVNEKPISMRLQPDEYAEAEKHADKESRKLGNFARTIFRMGVVVYRQRKLHGITAMPAMGSISIK